MSLPAERDCFAAPAMTERRMETIRVVCGHDCPDMCSLLAEVEGGRVKRIKGDPEQNFTAGFACAKVTRDAELVHSPARLKTPLRRAGPKGRGEFAPISWDAALDEITGRWRRIIAESGPLALLGYAYSAHQGQLNRGLVLGLFHALGASRLAAGTVCDTCCETAWDMTVGPIGGADPEAVDDSDLIVSWGADLVATNVHFWARVEAAQRRGVKLVVIDPRRSRTGARADLFLPIRIGTDAALALGLMHILARDGLVERDYTAAHTTGFDRLETQVLPRFAPGRVAEITGLAVADIEQLAALYGAAKRSFIRLGEGMTRLARGGEALRAVALLPGVTGAYGRRGGGALLLTASSCELDYAALRRPSGPAATRTVNHLRLGDALLHMTDPPIRALFIAANNPAVTNPDAGKVRQGLARDDLFTIVHDPFMTATARYADIVLPATTYLETEDFYRAYGTYYLQYAPQAVAPQGEAWSNLRLAQELARRMGLADAVFGMTPPGYFQAHTAYAGVAFLLRREGAPFCVLHPDDAASRGLADGAKVRLHNARGEVGLVLKIGDEIQPGVVLVPGQRPDDETVAGTVNMLVSDRYTDLGEGATYQSTFLDVEAWPAG